MDPKEIRELIELISRSSITRFELEGDDFKLKLVKAEPGTAALGATAALPAAAAPAPVAAAPAPAVATAAAAEEAPAVDDGLVALNSPIVGTFYGSPTPDSEAFVSVGSKIRKGQVVCIVEAMKVMNEIESEVDAEVVEIVVSNEQPVEYGEVLMRLRPTG